jgi:hypothetical protein
MGGVSPCGQQVMHQGDDDLSTPKIGKGYRHRYHRSDIRAMTMFDKLKGAAARGYAVKIQVGRSDMTTRYVVRSFALTLCLLFLARADSAKAADEDFTDVIGGACVPDSGTVRAGVYETRGFGVGFTGDSTGMIRLLCPYHLLGSTPWSRAKIGITLLSVIDDDGMEVGARVRAHLRRAGLGSNTAITIGTCDSNTSSITGPHIMICFGPLYAQKIGESYWWEVVIERTNPRVNVEFLAVGMRYYYP